MSLPRLNVQSGGWWVLQDHETADPYSVAYDHSNRPINFGARFEFSSDSDGIKQLGAVAGTAGPIGGWFCVPGAGSRTLAQWGQVFAAQITTASPLKATPVKGSSGWNTDTTLGEVTVTTSDGSSPSVGTFGLMVAGSDLGAQRALFFQGGSGTITYYKITTNNADGTYVGQKVEYPQGPDVAGVSANLTENNVSPHVPLDQIVEVTFTAGPGGAQMGYFNMPFGCP